MYIRVHNFFDLEKKLEVKLSEDTLRFLEKNWTPTEPSGTINWAYHNLSLMSKKFQD